MTASGRSRSLTSDRARRSLPSVCLAIGVVVSAFALGALHTEWLAICCIVTAIGLWTLSRSSLQEPRLTQGHLTLLAVGLGLTLWTALQLVPLPAAAFKAISPTRADIWARALTPVRQSGNAFHALSLDPPAGLAQITRGLFYICTFFLGARICAHHKGARFIERLLILSTVAMAAVAIIHAGFGLTHVYGIYEPKFLKDTRHVAPLVNSNHLAAYLNMGLALTLGGLVDKRRTFPNVAAVLMALTLLGTQFFVASRGGLMCTALMTILLFPLIKRSKRAKARTMRIWIWVCMVGLVLGSMVLASSEAAVAELGSSDFSKLAIFRDTLPMLKSYGFVGVGRGAFEPVFDVYQRKEGNWTFTHPENIVLQWSIEWGIPVAAAALYFIVRTLWPSGFSRRKAIGPWLALVMLGVHELVNFGSEVPGIMAVASLCAALYLRHDASEQPTVFGQRIAQCMRFVPTVAIIVAGLAATFRVRELGSTKTAIRESLHAPTKGTFDIVTAAMGRHPAESYFPFAGAYVATKMGTPVAPWVARALELRPVFGKAHLLLAESLRNQSPMQSRLEYRTALEQDSAIAQNFLRETPSLIRSFEDARDLLPTRGDLLPWAAEHLGRAVQSRLPATQLRLASLAHDKDPALLWPEETSLAADIDDVESGAAWCSRKSACAKSLSARADAHREAHPHSCLAAVFVARIRDPKELRPEHLNLLHDRITEASGDKGVCLSHLARLAFRQHEESRATAALDELADLPCTDEESCTKQVLLAADIERELGNERRAHAFLRRAATRAPSRLDLLERAALDASRLDLHAEAADTYRDLSERDPSNQEWRAAARRETELARNSIRR